MNFIDEELVAQAVWYTDHIRGASTCPQWLGQFMASYNALVTCKKLGIEITLDPGTENDTTNRH